ncbi:hypothetical protein CU098_008795 [Rhizopus stolonifer]|uniref:Uncharacterized protein n=1 Tax=Rhizopus stolonifer TaxID=4846 RepID=A0A367J1Q4_RHIST|nr:hypothetical protein CU098_008795 [Rhizopus stolonifer]
MKLSYCFVFLCFLIALAECSVQEKAHVSNATTYMHSDMDERILIKRKQHASSDTSMSTTASDPLFALVIFVALSSLMF